MKRLIRNIAVNFLSLWFAAKSLPGSIFFAQGAKTIFMTAAVLTVVNYTIKPLAKILLLPITILTLGLFRGAVNVLGLYLVTFLVNGFRVQVFDFVGFSYHGFIVPSFHASLVMAYFVVSFFLSLTVSFIFWLLRK